MNDQDPSKNQSSPEMPDASSAWDKVARFANERDGRRDSLDAYAVENFGVSLKDKREDLTPPMVPDSNGKLQPLTGRPFDTSKTVEMPVERSSGEIELWEALGMTEKTIRNPETGERVAVPVLVVGTVDFESGKLIVKEVIADKQVALLRRLEEERASQPVEEQPQPKSVSPEEPTPARKPEIDPNSPEGMLAGLSDKDQSALRSFAYHAANKRDAQRSGYGVESGNRSRWMGEALQEMTPDAKAIARKYAARLWGDENVAF